MVASMETSQATGSYASVNGLGLYYETYGTGSPLILLHGGLGVIGMFSGLLPALSQNNQVIGVDLQAHGRTADIDRPITYEAMADDIAGLIEHLGLGPVDVMGYSLGGGVALQTAIRHPELVRKLVLVSTAGKRDGWYPEVLMGMGQMNAAAAPAMVGTPMYTAYFATAPRVEDWPQLVDKVGTLLRQNYDWSTAIAELKIPVLLVYGDGDSIRLSHSVELFGLLGGGKMAGGMGGQLASQLAILPGTDHISIIFHPEMLLPLIPPFLAAPMPEAN